ncbi:MAG: hypothetical protein Q8M56_18245 [Desulfobacterales bacterium]|nr:hypothetical protein [Desulfobacterales bacterium]
MQKKKGQRVRGTKARGVRREAQGGSRTTGLDTSFLKPEIGNSA